MLDSPGMELPHWVSAGFKLGGGLWIASGLVVFLPLYLEFAAPLFGRRGRLLDFTVRCLFVLGCATLPGGSLAGATAVLRERTRTRARPVDPAPESEPARTVTLPAVDPA